MNLSRTTGLMYLGLAISGIAYYLGTRSSIFVTDDAAATLANITANSAKAHVDIALQLAVVVFQALAAWSFFVLYRPINVACAWAVGVFGTVNAVIILIAAAAAATGVQVAGEPSLAASGDTEAIVQLLYTFGAQLWGVGSIFFGLWLIPMGWALVAFERAPSSLGWTLVVAGVCYVLSAFVDYGIADAPTWTIDALTFLATIGEFWIIGYLLFKGAALTNAGVQRSQVVSRGA